MEKTKTILVVDDDAALCNALCQEIETAGYQTLRSYSSADAQKILQTCKVDLVVTDERMHSEGSDELLKKLKAGALEEPSLLLVSGFSDILGKETSDHGTLPSAGVAIAKPFKIEILLRKIEHCLSLKDRRWERVAPTSTSPLAIVSLHLTGFDEARKSSLLNIGRGGICVAVPKVDLAVGQTVRFAITVEKTSTSITGTAVVRWCRAENSISNLGLEFNELEEESVPKLVDLIDSLKPPAFSI